MRSTRVVFGALIVGALLPLAPAQAQPHIGGAIVARNDVRGQTQGRTQKIAEGDRVFQNQVVRTGADSLAKLVLLDETNVAVGPSSQVTLDRFVYDPQVGAKQVAIGAAAGAFRFISGRAPHEAYEVRTPQAIIGVRGTTYDVLVEAGRTRVVLQEGAVRVCRRAGVICIELTEPGQSAEVTDNGITGPIDPAQKTWDFGSLCGGAVDPCARVTQFALNDRPQPRRRAATATPQPRRAAVATEPPPPRRARPSRGYEIVEIERPVRVPPRRRVTPVYDDVETIYVRPRPFITLGVGPFFPVGPGGVRPGGGRPPGGVCPGGEGRPPGGVRPGGEGRPPGVRPGSGGRPGVATPTGGGAPGGGILRTSGGSQRVGGFGRNAGRRR